MASVGKFLGLQRGAGDKKKRQKYKDQFEQYRHAKIEVLLQLPHDVLMNLPDEALEKLPPERLAVLPPEPLARLSPQTLSTLPPEVIFKLPPDVLCTLTSEALARLPPGFISKLPPETLGRVLPAVAPEELQLVSKEALLRVDHAALFRLTPPSLLKLPDEVLWKLTSLPGGSFMSLPPEVLSRFPRSVFSRISYDTLKTIPIGTLHALPPEIRSALPEQLWQGMADQPPADGAQSPPSTIYQKPPSPGLDMPTEYLSNATSGLPASPGPTVPPRQPRGGPPLAYENGRSLKRSGSRSRPASRAASPPVEHHTSTPISQGREPYASHSPPKHRLDRRESHDVSKERLNRSLPEIEPETQRKDRGDSSDERYIARLKDDVDKLTEQVVKLRTEKMRMGDRLFEFLAQKTPNAWFDRDHQDPVAQILLYCEQLVKNAHENFLAADGLQLTLDTEKKKTEYLDQELDKATAEVERLGTDLGKLQGYLKQSDRDLQDASRVQASLEHERNQLRRQVTEKSRSLEIQKKQYDSQISSLNQQVAGLMETVDGLKAQLSKQKNDLARQMQAQAQYYNETQRAMEARYEQTEAGYKEALQSEKEKAQQQLEEQKTLLEQESKKQLLMLEQEMKKKVQALEQQLQTERQGRDKELAKKDDQHARNVVHLRDKILSLEADLVDNVDDFRPATDDALKSKYRELKLLVETITEPFNLGVHTMPQSSRLDPTRLLAREGSKAMRFLLRSIVWARLIDGFFSAPFGFGAFGSGNGKQQLINVYYEWRKLFDFSQSAYRGGNEDYEQFRRDKEANKWRSATFQSIMTAVVPRGQKKALAATADKVRPYADNRQNVEEDILDILREVCNGAVSDEFQEKVTEIVRLAGELALEFGSQRAELGLDMPERGDSVEIGLEFVDCEDGDNARGKVEEVELVVAPKLFRVGDGRNDLKTRKTVFPGEIYPMQT